MDLNSRPGKTPLLFLCHRIPYPPNKGDKIRSFHLLHHLQRHFDIHLATFVDDDADWPYVKEVEKLCKSSVFLPLSSWRGTLKSVAGIFTGEALSIPYYSSPGMRRWVEQAVAKHQIQNVIVYSSAMAQFVPELHEGGRSVIDFVDVDSDKWQQYAQTKNWPMSWLYQREATKLLELEKNLTEIFDAALFVSSSEAELFKRLAPGVAGKVGYYNNGVNTDYFDPGVIVDKPYPAASIPLVFTGAMDYWPNVDAVEWFAREVFPLLREDTPGLVFYIVGGNPSKRVTSLGSIDGVTVTGRVPDIRPYICHAAIAVAPMRVARGIQNKVLEAMALEVPVVVSPMGLEGIGATHGLELLTAEKPEHYRTHVKDILAGNYPGMGGLAREYVSHNFNWDKNLPEVVLLLNQKTPEACSVVTESTP